MSDHGNIIWAVGPACAFDADARSAFAALVRERALWMASWRVTPWPPTTWRRAMGYRPGTGRIYPRGPSPNGHYNHIDTINEVRRLGSIQALWIRAR